MREAILFPYLGIKFAHVGKAITIFGYDITFYGILTGIALLAGVGIVLLEVNYNRKNTEEYLNYMFLAILSGIVGARIYYVLFSFETYKGHLGSIFNLHKGGMEFYGALIGVIIMTLVYSFLKNESAGEMLDMMTGGILIFQVISCWGNFFNRESFGEYTEKVFAMKIPIDSVRTVDVTDRMRNHIDMIGGIRFIQVHPVFLYEMLWCIGLIIVLLLYRQYQKSEGELFLIYLFGYGIGSFWMEGLRTDALRFWGSDFRVTRGVCVISIVAAVIIYIYLRMNSEHHKFRKIRNANENKLMRFSSGFFHRN